MINLLGLPLYTAKELLEAEGYMVEAVETRSRKGVDGDSKRVVRILEKNDDSHTIQLVYCEFKTNL